MLCAILTLTAQAGAQAASRVWVNTRSGVYHCAGTPAYGKTAMGEYLSEDEARRRGFRANGGRACGRSDAQGLLQQGERSNPNTTLPDSAPAAPAVATRPCVVTRISDGDTFECGAEGRVRLIGLDAPEAAQEPYGTAATAALASLLPLGAAVELELDRDPRDRNNRVLAYVWHEGRFINWLLVRQGWALSGRYPPNLRYAAMLEAAEARARAEGRGLWRVDGFRCRPDQFRERACSR